MGEFPNVFRVLRQSANLTQEELAAVLGISKSSISMYENGNRQPDFETLEVIADYFNVDMDYLLGRSRKTTVLEPGIEKEPGYQDVELLIARNGKEFSTEQKMRLIKLLSEID